MVLTDIDLEVAVVLPRGKALSSSLFTFLNSVSDCLMEASSCEMVPLKSQQIDTHEPFASALSLTVLTARRIEI